MLWASALHTDMPRLALSKVVLERAFGVVFAVPAPLPPPTHAAIGIASAVGPLWFNRMSVDKCIIDMYGRNKCIRTFFFGFLENGGPTHRILLLLLD